MAKTPDRLRKEAERERRREAGIKRVECYAHPDDIPKLRAYAEKLLKARKPHNSQGDRG